MNVYSELIQAQLEILSADPAQGTKGRIYLKDGIIRFDNGSSIQSLINGTVGEVKMAKLSEAQFQEDYGTGWILEDGRVLANATADYPVLKARRPEWFISANDTIQIPDSRGMFLRGGNNGRSDEYADPQGNRDGFNVTQSDAQTDHMHTLSTSDFGVASGSNIIRILADPAFAHLTDYKTKGASSLAGIDSENRPNNITTNFFIKVR